MSRKIVQTHDKIPQQKSIKTFSSIVDLRKFAKIKSGVIYKTTGSLNGDWILDQTDTKSPDNEGTIVINVSGQRLKRRYQGYAKLEWFGVRAGDKLFDNSSIIQKAISSCKTVLFPKNKTYFINKEVRIEKINGIKINMNTSTLINNNYDSKTLEFDYCNTITVEGGTITRPVMPTVQNNKDQHTVTFIGCRDIIVRNMHISNSPEMGICLMSAIGATISNNTIEHTLRDGVYSHYSLNLKYLGNKLSFIKDDALSIHDYGLTKEKPEIIRAGYKQAGRAVVSNNIINNAVQGFSSIGCSDITISKNYINRTANAGIAVFNSETLSPGSTARVKNINIEGNNLIKCGDTAIVNGLVIANGGQVSSGRAAIYVASNGQDGSFLSSKLRSSKISISGNVVRNSGVNGILCYNIDGLLFFNNSFMNCHSNTKNGPQFTGNICEVYNCTDIIVRNNSVIDNRKVPLHDSAYIIDSSSGKFSKGKNVGWRSFEIRIDHSPSLSLIKP